MIHCYVPDIFFKTKLTTILDIKKKPYKLYPYLDELLNSAFPTSFIIVDIEQVPDLHKLAKFSNVYGFCSHTKTDLILKAKGFGIHVYPKSVFFKEISKLIEVA